MYEGEETYTYRTVMGLSEGKNDLEKLGEDGRIMLKFRIERHALDWFGSRRQSGVSCEK
jgi:hypothetical protein